MKNAHITLAAAWIAIGIAVTTAIIVTRRVSPMWFFLIPFVMNLCSSSGSTEKKGEIN